MTETHITVADKIRIIREKQNAERIALEEEQNKEQKQLAKKNSMELLLDVIN